MLLWAMKRLIPKPKLVVKVKVDLWPFFFKVVYPVSPAEKRQAVSEHEL